MLLDGSSVLYDLPERDTRNAGMLEQQAQVKSRKSHTRLYNSM